MAFGPPWRVSVPDFEEVEESHEVRSEAGLVPESKHGWSACSFRH